MAPEPEDSFEARMSEALRAIRKAQGLPEPPEADTRRGFSLAAWLKALDKLPPIRLPVGPSIPWRVGLPAMIALVAVMFLVSRPTTSRADTPLPAQETYEVQQAPLFSHTDDAPAATPTPAPIGVPEPSGASFDIMDVGFKLVAVLALAYGSLMLLKRAGVGGAGTPANAMQGMKVISSLALAPNRSVHVIRVPGGRTLLVGATPNAVNLLADLGVLDEEETPEASSFLDALKGKLG